MRTGLIGLAVGLLVGYLVGGQSDGTKRPPSRAGPSEAPLPPVAEIRAAQHAESRHVEREADPIGNVVAAEHEPVMPTSRRTDLDSEALKTEPRGMFEVDFGATDGEAAAWIQQWNLFGNVQGWQVIEPARGEGRIVREQDYPGLRDVWWHDASGRRRGTRDVVRAGWVTRIDASDPRYVASLPIPPGVGLVEGRVLATDGGGLGRYPMNVTNKMESVIIDTTRAGCFSATLHPGRTRLRSVI